jgi:cytochrome c553
MGLESCLSWDIVKSRALPNPPFPPLKAFCMMSRTKSLALSTLSAATLSLLCAAAQAATPAPAFKADPVKGQQLAASCGACHTQDGSRGAPANPILQGQHPEYLVKQLSRVQERARAPERHHGRAWSAALDNEDMKHIAAFYAAKQAGAGGFATRTTEGRSAGGDDLPRRHRRSQDPRLRGLPQPRTAPASRPSTHGLNGQHADYTEAQLLAFRSGARANNAQMTTIAAQAERPRDQGGGRLPGGPALTPLLRGQASRRPARCPPGKC